MRAVRSLRKLTARQLAHLVIVLTLFVGAVWQLGSSAMILTKAALAQVLIENAWQKNRQARQLTNKPWSWADTAPVAKLHFVRSGKPLVVLSGDSGRVMAFGPGHNESTPLPGTGGNSVISGHRDTHFAVLRDVRTDDPIHLETIDGKQITYRISGQQVVDKSEVSVMRDHGIDELTLVTCWPFDALTPNGPLRLVVSAQRVADNRYP